MPDSSQSIVIYILIAIAAITVIALAVILLDKFVFAKSRCKRMLKEITTKYEYANALLTGQDNSYIQRLEVISRTNLLYNDVHSTYYKRAREIKDINGMACQEFIMELGSTLEENKIKEFKTLYKERHGIVNQFVELVDQLNADLLNVIKPEEDARQTSLQLKEALRELKSKYHINESELSYVGASFENVFDKIDERFREYDANIDNANYDEANEVTPVIKGVIENLTRVIDELPPILNDINHEIPERIAELEKRYKKLTQEGKPLKHLQVEAKIDELNHYLDRNKDLLRALNIAMIPNYDQQIFAMIDNINKQFDDEEASYKEFNENEKKIVGDFLSLETSFIQLTNNLPKFEKIYVIDFEHKNNLNKIKATLEMVSRDKRLLDNCLHGYDNYPYSDLLKKLKALDQGTQDVRTQFDNFTAYLNSLKVDSDSSYKSIKAKYSLLRKNELFLRQLKNPIFIEQFKDKVQESYDYIDDIYKTLKSVPIDVNKVNDLTKKLNDTTNTIFTEIGEISHYKTLAEENIILVNRDRMKFTEINNIVSQAETLFLNGEYKSAYLMCEEARKKLAFRDQQ